MTDGSQWDECEMVARQRGATRRGVTVSRGALALAIVVAVPAQAQEAADAAPATPPPPPSFVAPDVAIPDDLADLLNPDAPLAPLPELTVPWPELDAPTPRGAPDQVAGPGAEAPPRPPALPPLPDAELADVPPVELPPELSPGGSPAALASGDGAADADAMALVADDLDGDGVADADPVRIAQPGRMRRYSVRLTGVDDVADDVFKLRFDELSELNQRDGDDANVAQLRLRAKTDTELVGTLLRNKGHYDNLVTTRILPGASDDRLIVELVAEPGPLYHYKGVNLPGVEAAAAADSPMLRAAFAVAVGDVIDADRLETEQASLLNAMRENGYAFGELGEELVTIDHDDRSGILDQPVTPGDKFRFGAIVPAGDDIFGARHLQRIARFAPGDVYKQSLQQDLHNAVIATGLVSSVRVTPTRSATPGVIDMQVETTAAPPRTIAGELGYDTGEGIRAEVSWTHRNFVRPEGALTLRGILGTREQLLSTSLRRNNFKGRDRILSGLLEASNVDRDAYKAITATAAVAYERKTTLLFQKDWTWSLGAEIVASSERPKLSTGTRREFYIAALPMALGFDGSDDLLNPQRGFRLFGRVSPELSWAGGTHTYARVQLDGSGYYPVNDNLVVAGRARVGTIAGAGRFSIAPSRLFYAGGGGSVRGFSYQGVGPRDVDNVPIGGRSLTELSLEARIRWREVFGIVPFIDAGHVSTTTVPKFSQLSVGAGVGFRYYSSFGPIRIDLATPLTRRPGDSRIAVYVSLGQAF